MRDIYPKPTVVGVFANRAQAEAAVDHLWHENFQHDQIGLAAPGELMHTAQTPEGRVEDTAARGAVTGAVAGGTVGAIAGALATGLIPGVGPIIAGGILTGMLTGAAAGAAVGTFAGPFIAMGFSHEQARAYEHSVRAGHTIVVVRAGPRALEAEAILRNEGAFDVHRLEPTGNAA
jgi:hypothetical protein